MRSLAYGRRMYLVGRSVARNDALTLDLALVCSVVLNLSSLLSWFRLWGGLSGRVMSAYLLVLRAVRLGICVESCYLVAILVFSSYSSPSTRVIMSVAA